MRQTLILSLAFCLGSHHVIVLRSMKIAFRVKSMSAWRQQVNGGAFRTRSTPKTNCWAQLWLNRHQMPPPRQFEPMSCYGNPQHKHGDLPKYKHSPKRPEPPSFDSPPPCPLPS